MICAFNSDKKVKRGMRTRQIRHEICRWQGEMVGEGFDRLEE